MTIIGIVISFLKTKGSSLSVLFICLIHYRYLFALVYYFLILDDEVYIERHHNFGSYPGLVIVRTILSDGMYAGWISDSVGMLFDTFNVMEISLLP